MFARNVSFTLKLGRAAQFARLLEYDIIPVLQTQRGFRDEITFVSPGGVDAVGISLWEQKEDAEKYALGAYPGVLKALEHVLEGTPQVTTYEVSNSTFHELAARAVATSDRRQVSGRASQRQLGLDLARTEVMKERRV